MTNTHPHAYILVLESDPRLPLSWLEMDRHLVEGEVARVSYSENGGFDPGTDVSIRKVLPVAGEDYGIAMGSLKE